LRPSSVCFHDRSVWNGIHVFLIVLRSTLGSCSDSCAVGLPRAPELHNMHPIPVIFETCRCGIALVRVQNQCFVSTVVLRREPHEMRTLFGIAQCCDGPEAASACACSAVPEQGERTGPSQFIISVVKNRSECRSWLQSWQLSTRDPMARGARISPRVHGR
jgi:hypothetical protein